VNLEKFLTVTMDFLGLQYDPRHSRVFGNLWAADFWKKKPWDLVAFQEANSTLWVLCCQPLLAVE